MRNRPSARRSRPGVWIVGGSLLLHAVALSLLPAHVARPHAQPSSIVLFESATPNAPAAAPPVASAELPVTAHAAPPAPVISRAASAVQPPPRDRLAEPPPAGTSEIAVAPPAPMPAAAPQARAPIDLSPRAAALSIASSTDEAREPPAPSSEQLARDRSQALSASLRAAARAEVDRLKPRQLELRRDADGTCHYAGTAIDATILADGGVVFSDKAIEPDVRWGVDEPQERVPTPDEAVAPQRLELGMRVASRAWAAERVWFLRETEGIRQELADAAHERELRAAESRLRAQLDRIWCDAARSKPARRRAIYAVWADISSDALGQRGRAVIVDYIRRNLPAGSPDAYTQNELTELASLSEPAQRFDPYAAGGSLDAGPPLR